MMNSRKTRTMGTPTTPHSESKARPQLILVALLATLPTITLAAPSEYLLLAPLPGLTEVSLTEYLEGAVTVTIGLAGILAVVMTVICGIQMIGSPSVSQKSASKQCITSALFGLLLAISSWVILNTINDQLLSSDIGLLNVPNIVLPPPPAPADAPRPVAPGFYYRYREAAGDPIQNSPHWPSVESCLVGMTQEKADGRIIEKTPAGSTVECFQVFPAPPGTPPVKIGDPPIEPPLADAQVRIAICGNNSCVGATPVGINKGPCPTPLATDCTSVIGLDSAVVNILKQIGMSTPIVLSGGTEAGHKSHGAGRIVFDLRKTTALSNFIKQNATQSATSFVGCRYLYNGFWFTDEIGAAGGPHWHVCKNTEPEWYCKDQISKTNTNALPPGIAKNCPR